MTIKFSIIIPCYDEEKNIPLNLKRLDECITDDTIEVIIVDNGSSDNTQNVLNDLLPKYPFAHSVKVETNQGYGFGILSGLRQTKGEILAWTHADMQTDPADVIKAAEIMNNQKDPTKCFVKGNRKQRPFSEQFFEKGMCFFESMLFGKWLYDINAQPNMFHRDFYKKWQSPPHHFGLDLYAYILAKKHNLNIIRFPVLFPKRIHGESHFHTNAIGKIKVAKRVIQYSKELKKSFRNSQ